MRKNSNLNYSYEKLYGQGDNAADIVLSMVPLNIKVLELGAGPGSITRRLHSERGSQITAVELEPSFLPHLEPSCEKVIRANLNEPEWINQLEGLRWDNVVIADVLEHLDSPRSLLLQCKSILKEGGSIVISLPHIGHAVIYACLIYEDFDYRDAGLLDKTHKHFLGLKNIQALIESADMKIVQAAFVSRQPEDTEYADRWRYAPDDLKQAVLRHPNTMIYQVVARVVPASACGDTLNLMELTCHAPQVTSLMRLNRVLKRFVPHKVYRCIRHTYAAAVRILYKRV